MENLHVFVRQNEDWVSVALSGDKHRDLCAVEQCWHMILYDLRKKKYKSKRLRNNKFAQSFFSNNWKQNTEIIVHFKILY